MHDEYPVRFIVFFDVLAQLAVSCRLLGIIGRHRQQTGILVDHDDRFVLKQDLET
ncbi:hypothetical protein SDC9_114672 [bioreactor metagenome]|uniref:Uncharacterized protein n=1 Tax=bioreactor metagenome TaxID=1076179 RepID=A0A645BRN0_9ZZZZ